MFFISTSRARVTGVTATGMLAAALVLSGCSADTSANEQNESPTAAAQSASASPSQAKESKSSQDSKKSDDAKDSKTQDAKPAQKADSESTAKSEDISNSSEKASEKPAKDSNKIESRGEGVKATQVALDQENVTKTQDLYNQYGNVLQNVETKTVDKPSEEEASQIQENTATGESIALSDKTTEEIKKVSTGSAADEFTVSALEFATSGWDQEGSTKFVGEPKIADTEFQGKPAKLLEVCVDSSDVKIKDKAGNVLTPENAPKRSLNIFTLIEDNGSWKIAYREMPDNPDC